MSRALSSVDPVYMCTIVTICTLTLWIFIFR